MKQLIILWIGVFAVAFLCLACSESNTAPADDGGKTDSAPELGTTSGGQSDGSEVESTSGGDEGTSASTGQSDDASGSDEDISEETATVEDVGEGKPDIPPIVQSCVSGNDNCPLGTFCRVMGCTDGLDGSCVAFPEECPEGYDPVCSCADVTFDNACESYKAGVNVAGPGMCEGEQQGCILDGPDVCPKGWFCRGDCQGKYLCQCTGAGICTQKPTTACDGPEEFVCGCDGVTYASPCLANQNGINVKLPNKCIPKEGAKCGGAGGVGCLDGQGCNVEGCEPANMPGKCKNYTILCVGGAQCGCDGTTYETFCKRLDAGVAKKHDGKCTVDGELPYCDLAAENSCEGNTFCKGDSGQCEGQGICTVKPFICVGWLGKKVCACDGTTYDSPCHAQKVNTPIKSTLGPCAGG